MIPPCHVKGHRQLGAREGRLDGFATHHRVRLRADRIDGRGRGILRHGERIPRWLLARANRVKNGPGHEAEAGATKPGLRAQLTRPRTNSTNVPTGTPVGPFGSATRSVSEYAVPAMSRCTHG